jgi:radical SAM protein with 4Fe4S-binding SPASM domain
MRTVEQAALIEAATGDGCVPWQVHWDLTYACQLKCAMCYQMNLDWNRKAELPTERILETLDEMRDLGTQEVTFSGGDPFARRDFLQIVEHACAGDFSVTIYSSGQVVKPAVAQHLADCGVASVEVTLLGSDAETHDAITQRPGSFDRLLGSVRNLTAAGVNVMGKTVVLTRNVHQVERLIELCRELGIGTQMDPNVWRPWNGSEAQIHHLRLDAEGRQEFHRRYGKPEPQDRTCAMGVALCNAGRKRLGITPFGKVNPCITYGERMVLGDLRRQSITEIWLSSPAMRKYRALTPKSYHKCDSCDMSAFCDWCPGLFSWAGNAYTEPYESLCDDTRAKKQVWEQSTGQTWKPLPVVNGKPVALA